MSDMASIGAMVAIGSLGELYGFSRECVGDLERSGHQELADEVERALTGDQLPARY